MNQLQGQWQKMLIPWYAAHYITVVSAETCRNYSSSTCNYDTTTAKEMCCCAYASVKCCLSVLSLYKKKSLFNFDVDSPCFENRSGLIFVANLQDTQAYDGTPSN